MPDELRPDQVSAYLARIGAPAGADASLSTLRLLQSRQLATVPFETLSMGLDEVIGLDPADLVDKVVRRRRGGFCYELNGLFGHLLRALGFRVDLLAAATYDRDGRLSAPLDHAALRVSCAGTDWLVDVGFGPFAAEPLDLAEPGVQADGHRLAAAEHGDIDVLAGRRPLYRLEARPRRLTDFAPTCWWQQTSADSHFAKDTLCSLPVDGGRLLLRGRTLVDTGGDRTVETVLEEDAAVLAVLRERFGIHLDRAPAAPRAPSSGRPCPAP